YVFFLYASLPLTHSSLFPYTTLFRSFFADNVFNPNETSIGCIAVKDDALVQIVAKVNAKMRGLDLPADVISIKMKPVEVCAHGIKRIFWLHQTRPHIQ